MYRSATINFNHIGESNWDFRPKIYLRPTAQYGFHCTHFKKKTIHKEEFFSGNLVRKNLSKSKGKKRRGGKYGEMFIYVLKLSMYVTVSIFTKITNAPRNQESTPEIEFQLNRSRHFASTGTRLRPSIIYDWRYSDFHETQVSLTIFV
jgi:hypothetical protein